MACDVPVRQCLYEHIAPKLAGAKITNGGATVRARCPVCGDPRTLTVSAGEHQRIVWNCFTGCPRSEIRASLTRAGVTCLPRGKSATAEAIETVSAVLRELDQNRGRAILRAHLILLGYTHWPKGDVLLGLAAEVGVGRSEAFAAKAAGPLHPVRPVPTPADEQLSSRSSNAQASGLFRMSERVRSSGQVRSTGLSEVRSTGLLAGGQHS